MIFVELFNQYEESFKIFIIFEILIEILQFIDHALKLAHEQTKHSYSKQKHKDENHFFIFGDWIKISEAGSEQRCHRKVKILKSCISAIIRKQIPTITVVNVGMNFFFYALIFD